MDYSSTKRISEANAIALAAEQGIDILNREVGILVSIKEGDILTVGDSRVLKAVNGGVLTEEGKWNSSCFWAAESTVTHLGIDSPIDWADASFSRTGKRFPSREEKVTVRTKVEDNLGGNNLWESILETLTPEQQALNRDLSKREDGLAKLTRLAGRKLRCIKRVEAFRLRMRPKDANPDEWGTKPAHWSRVNLLFFEEVPAEPASNPDASTNA